MNLKCVVIVGAHGQDGQLLTRSLIKKNVRVIGIARDCTKDSLGETLPPIDIYDFDSVALFLKNLQPHEVYYLAAHHHSAQEAQGPLLDLFEKSYCAHVQGLLHFLEGIRIGSPQTKLFFASSSLIFGSSDGDIIYTEDSSKNPDSAYGITKLSGMQTCQYYRKSHKIFASSGILFNHESYLRSDKFLSKKLVKAAVDIKLGKKEPLVLGDLSAKVDWGAAEDFVEAFQCILGVDQADDFIVAMGQSHSVADFARIAFGNLNLSWNQWVVESPGLIRRASFTRIGNPSKLKKLTGWNPSIGFEEMVIHLVNAELNARA